MRTKYNKRRFRTAIMIILILFCMSIGYSYLLTTLNIEGTSNIKANTWDVHWENVSVKSGSVTGDQVPIAAHILGDTTQVEYSVILKSPGDFYEFTVDAKNAGTLDAMVDIVDTKFYESNGVTEIGIPNYLEYEFLYSNGIYIEENQLLEANSSKTIKVKVKFKDNLDESQLPTTDKTIVIRQSITYIQADENAIETPNTRFAQDSWSDINSNIISGHTDIYNIGDTKEVDMESFGTHTLRIANKSLPSECSTPGFSQTACGFVLEFTDIITEHNMNPQTPEYQYGYNIDGWPASSMYTYLNDNIFNSLPSALKENIIDTTVVSGHGSTPGENNTTSYDKLYLLSPKEIGSSYTDYASNSSRTLDYYSNVDDIRKKYNNNYTTWWLRTPYYATNSSFLIGYHENYVTNSTSFQNMGVSPAFRYGDGDL